MESETEKDPFIGQRFGPEGQIEVIGKCERFYNVKRHYYKVVCHICKNDPDLHGTATYECLRSSALKGKLPCGCSSRPRWSQEQYKTLIFRTAIKKGVEVLETADPILSDSKLTLKCWCGHIWNTTKVVSFVMAKNNCPACGQKNGGAKSRISDEIFIDKFLATGKFQEGTVFKRVEQPTSRREFPWEVICPKCSFDGLVKEGLCKGIFRSTAGRLMRGVMPCRCAPTWRYTKAQQEFRINRYLENTSLRFDSWVGSYKGCESDIRVICEEHEDFHTTVNKLVNRKHGCPICNTGGFFSENPATFYVLRIEGQNCGFTGFGISGEIMRRLCTHKRELNKHGLRIEESMYFDFDDGKDALHLETLVKREFELFSQQVSGFRKEATYLREYDNVVYFAKTFYDSKQQEES